MTIVKSRPTSPGRRFRVKISNKDIYQGQPHQPLLVKLNKSGGRNNQGRITSRRMGGGVKRKYRLIDFKRNKFDIVAEVIRNEYDPNRSAFISLIKYDDGNGNLVEKILEPGDVSHYPPGAIHQEEALEDCYIIEASTNHFNDRVRCEELYNVEYVDGLPTTSEEEIIEK